MLSSFDPAPSIKRYCTNIRETNAYQTWSITHRWDSVIENIGAVMSRKYKRVPMVIEQEHVSWQQILSEIAALIEKDEVPAYLTARNLFALNFRALLNMLFNEDDRLSTPDQSLTDRASFAERDVIDHSIERFLLLSSEERKDIRDEIVKRLHALLREIAQTPNAYLLSIGPFYRLMEFKIDASAFDVGAFLRPILVRKHLPLFGSCSIELYDHYLSQDPVTRSFHQKIVIGMKPNSNPGHCIL